MYAGLQVASAASSVAAWVAIDHQQRIISTATDENAPAVLEAKRRRQLYRDAWSIPSAAAFYVTWGASVIDAGVSWRKDRLASLGASVAPRSDGLEVAITGRF